MTAELLAAAEAGRVRVAIGRASDFFGPGVTEGPRSASGSSDTPWTAGAPTSSETLTCRTPTATSSYAFTAAASIRAVEETLARSLRGALSPAAAFGATFILTIADTTRLDTLPAEALRA